MGTPEAPLRQRVTHVLPTYLPRTETFLYNLISSHEAYVPMVLAGAVANRDEFPLDSVADICARPGRPLLNTVLRWQRRSRGWKGQLEFGIYRATRGRSDVLHAHYGPIGCESLAAQKRLEIPLVTSFYGYDLALPRSPSWRTAYDHLFAQGTLFVCEGPHMAAHLVRIGCPKHKVRVVPIGVRPETIPFRVRPARQPLVALQVARLVEKKGVDLSIQAFAEAGGHFRGWELWIVGDGPQRASLQALAQRLRVASSVRFCGELPHSRLRDLLARADVGIQPSRTASDGDTEGGAPTVLLEMQAAGMPVVATRHADIPFVVADPDCLANENSVSELAAALSRVSELSTQQRRETAERCREFITARHDARKVAQLMETVYDDAKASLQEGGAVDRIDSRLDAGFHPMPVGANGEKTV